MANDVFMKWAPMTEERSDPASARLWAWDLHIPRLWRSCVRVTAVVSEALGPLPFYFYSPR